MQTPESAAAGLPAKITDLADRRFTVLPQHAAARDYRARFQASPASTDALRARLQGLTPATHSATPDASDAR